MMFVLSQIFGVIALCFASWSYFVSGKVKFLIIQIIVNIFYAASFLVIDAYVGGLTTAISIIRCLYLIYYFKYGCKYNLLVLFVFVVLYVLVATFVWDDWLDILPLASSIIYTFAYSVKNMQLMKIILIIPSILLIIYCCVVGAYASALLDVVELISIVVAIHKYKYK